MNRLAICLTFMFATASAVAQPRPVTPHYEGLDTRAYLTVIPTPQRERYAHRFFAVTKATVECDKGADDPRIQDDLTQHLQSIGLALAAADGDGVDFVVRLRLGSHSRHPLPGNIEGYDLEVGLEGRRAVATVTGHSPLGVSHGVQSLKQLTMRWHDATIIREAIITDWPTIKYRFVKRASDYWLDQARRYRMNGGSQQLALNDQGRLSQKNESLQAIATRADRRLLHVLAMVNMGNVYRGSDADVSGVVEQFARLDRAGWSHIAIMNDDRMTRLDAAAMKRFDSYVDAQLHYARRIAETVGRGTDPPRLAFMPNFYYGRDGMYRPYGDRLKGRLPEGVALFWAGIGTPGPSVDVQHLQSVKAQVDAKRLWFYTNWPQVGHPFFTAENYNAARDRDFGQGDLVELVTVSTTTYPRALPVSFITMCDLLWNPNAYDPVRSLRRATAEVVGPQSFEAFYRLFSYVDSVSRVSATDQRGPMYVADDPDERRRIVTAITDRIDTLAGACLKTPAASDARTKTELSALIGRRQRLLERIEQAEAKLSGDLATRTIDCPRATTAPALDGQLDDDAWTGAAVLDGFTDLSGSKAAPHQTTVRLVRTDDAVYLGITAQETHMTDAALSDPEREYPVPINQAADAFLWWSESVEVFFDPGRDRRDVVQVMLNPWGMKEGFGFSSLVYGYFGLTDKHRENWPVRGMVNRTSDSWVIECAFPRRMFKDTDWKGPWGFNVARNRRLRAGDGMKYSTWTPLGWGFQDASTFGLLRFAPGG